MRATIEDLRRTGHTYSEFPPELAPRRPPGDAWKNGSHHNQEGRRQHAAVADTKKARAPPPRIGRESAVMGMSE